MAKFAPSWEWWNQISSATKKEAKWQRLTSKVLRHSLLIKHNESVWKCQNKTSQVWYRVAWKISCLMYVKPVEEPNCLTTNKFKSYWGENIGMDPGGNWCLYSYAIVFDNWTINWSSSCICCCSSTYFMNMLQPDVNLTYVRELTRANQNKHVLHSRRMSAQHREWIRSRPSENKNQR